MQYIDQLPSVLRQPSRDPPTHSMLPRAQLSKEIYAPLSTKKETLSPKIGNIQNCLVVNTFVNIHIF